MGGEENGGLAPSDGRGGGTCLRLLVHLLLTSGQPGCQTEYLGLKAASLCSCCSLQYLRVTGAGSKKKGGGRLTAFHPNLFTYAGDSVGSHAVTVPPSYIALGRACVAEDPLQRPTFDEVLSALEVVRRDAERMNEATATPAVYVMPELEPDPETLSMNTREGVVVPLSRDLAAVHLQQDEVAGVVPLQD